MTTALLSEDPRLRAALAWILTAVGSLVFAVVHLFAALGGLVAEAGHEGHDHGGHDHLEGYALLADPNSWMSWTVALVYLLGIVPPLLALVFRSRTAGVVALVLGGLLTLGSVVDGFSHAAADGSLTALLTALVAVGLPGALAVVATVQWIRRSGDARPPAA